jgi:hypothetical protein
MTAAARSAEETRRPADGPRSAAGHELRSGDRQRPIVLVHGGAPWQANGGAVFLEAVAAHAGRPCVHLSISLEGRPYDVPPDFPRPVLQIAARGGLRGMGILQRRAPRMARKLYWGALYPALLRHRMSAAATAIRGMRPHRLVFFLNAVETPIVAGELARLVGVPHATMEWDLLDIAIEELQLSGQSHRRLMSALASVRSGAAARGVASEGMLAYYQRSWGLDARVLRQPVAAIPARGTTNGDGPFVIAVCGNVYAPAEFRALVAALDRLGWSVGGRTIDLRVIGEIATEVGPVSPRIAVSGWVSYRESLARLAGADLGYCPYWFDEAKARIVTTSFPSKIISYLSCGVPMFYHGPKEGTPAQFLARYPVGVGCYTLDPVRIAETLAQLIAAPARMTAARTATTRALAEEFSEATLQHRLADWLGDNSEGSRA